MAPSVEKVGRVEHHLSRIGERRIDIAIATLLALGAELELLIDDPAGIPLPLAVPATLLLTLSLVARRSHPFLVGFFVPLGALALDPTGQSSGGVLFVAMLVASYSFGAYAQGGSARAAATASWLAALAAAGLLVAPPGETVGLVAIMGGAWLAGRLLRQRGEAAALFRDEAERAERESAERARTAVAEERAHIARELHDIVAHSISVMVLQTGAGRQVMDRDPDKAREMLSSVERSGREAMDEMQRLVGIMRAREGMLDYRPQPGLAELDELVKGSEGAGLAVRVNRNGDPNGISPGVDLAAYRIVQEALTNAIKHADASEVELSLDYRAGRLEICVRDDGVGANGSPTGQGHGLVGMRERAALYGGQLHAGAREGGGFEVRATLPTREPAE